MVNILQIRTRFVCFYVLRDGDGLYLIDTGFLGGMRSLKRGLKERGWEDLPVRGVFLTHGHLDHVFNVSAVLREYPDAWVAAPAGDRELMQGKFMGASGLGKIAGIGQQMAAAMFRYRKPESVRYFEPGESFDVCGGLLSIPLPGHTPGHCGYLLGDDLLFAGDVFASVKHRSHRPPAFFNHSTVGAEESLQKVAVMPLTGVYLGHCDKAAPEVHLARLRNA